MTYDQLMESSNARVTRGTRGAKEALDAAFGRAFEAVEYII